MKTRTLTTEATKTEPTESALVLPGAVSGALDNLPGTDSGEVPASQGGIYISAAHPLSANWQSCQAAGVKEGEYYVTLEGKIRKLAPAQFFFLKGKRSFTKMSKQGEILGTSPKQQPGYDEHYTALLILLIDGKLYPSRSDFRGTKCGSIAPAFKALADAADPSFGTQSDAHRVAASFPKPFGRVLITSYTQAATSKTSGNLYHAGRATVAPATLSQMQLLVDAFKNDPAFIADLDAATNSYLKRVDEIS